MTKSFLALALFAFACGTSTTVEAPPPAPSPSVAPAILPAKTTVYVTASSVNIRRDPSMAGEVLKQAKKNEALTLLSSLEDWTKVELPDGTVGWVASRFVSQSRSASAPPAKAGCNTDFAFIKTPKPSFAEGESKHGLVVVDAYVNRSGDVTSTKVVTNETADPKLAAMAENEIRSAKFEAPKRGCVARAFIFTYKRSF
ncbi:MAG TPA: SH3 domain-containing protein [Thermoanaerobaculia bacterium]|nr:SH3 domain-containing protein [Thermoanaerobaculia bacterium]